MSMKAGGNRSKPGGGSTAGAAAASGAGGSGGGRPNLGRYVKLNINIAKQKHSKEGWFNTFSIFGHSHCQTVAVVRDDIAVKWSKTSACL